MIISTNGSDIREYAIEKSISVAVNFVPIVAKVFTVAPAMLNFYTADPIAATVTWEITEADTINFAGDLITGLQPATGSKVINIKAAQLQEATDIPYLTGRPIQLTAKNSNDQEYSQTIFLYQGVLPSATTTTIDAELQLLRKGNNIGYSPEITTAFINLWTEMKAHILTLQQTRGLMFTAIYPALGALANDKDVPAAQRSYFNGIYQAAIDNIKPIGPSLKASISQFQRDSEGMMVEINQQIKEGEISSNQPETYYLNRLSTVTNYYNGLTIYHNAELGLVSDLSLFSESLGKVISGSGEVIIKLYLQEANKDMEVIFKGLKKQLPA